MSESAEHAFAVVEAVEAEGLRLKFDGEETAGEKLYKCNTFFKFSAGDRVYCVKDSGTFVAICKIGAPAKEIVADKAETVESVESVESAESAEAVKDNSNESYLIKFRGVWMGTGVQYCRVYEGASDNEKWFPLGCPIDQSVNYENVDAIVQFASTYDGKLQFCLPYRNPNAWYTVATE